VLSTVNQTCLRRTSLVGVDLEVMRGAHRGSLATPYTPLQLHTAVLTGRRALVLSKDESELNPLGVFHSNVSPPMVVKNE